MSTHVFTPFHNLISPTKLIYAYAYVQYTPLSFSLSAYLTHSLLLSFRPMAPFPLPLPFSLSLPPSLIFNEIPFSSSL